MNHAAFVARFPEASFIGEDITENEARYFFDNGTDIGVWRQDRRTTCGQGEILDPDTSHIARHYYREKARITRTR